MTTNDSKAPLKEVEGKVAFITGGSSGIGLGIARAFAEAGMNVAIGYRTEEHREQALQCLASSGGRIHAIHVEVTDRPGMQQAAREIVEVFGKVHVLVNNAGVYFAGPTSRVTYDDWDWMMGVNVSGVFNGVHAFLPYLQAHGEGAQIVTTSSVFGLFTLRENGVYSASKYAVVALMEALRVELAESNIGVSVYCPGVVNSNVVNSARNRPSGLAETSIMPDAAQIAQCREELKNPEAAMDPLEAGRLVLRGMRHNDLYIFSHPEFEPIMQHRHEAIIASIPADLRATQARVDLVRRLSEKAIYATERDRLRNTQLSRDKPNS